MVIDNIFSKIKEVWQDVKEDGNAYLICNMKQFSDAMYLHQFFKPKDLGMYSEYFARQGFRELPELMDFYKSFNGCKMFLMSLSIYGAQVDNFTDNYLPFDISISNYNTHTRLKNTGKDDENVIFIGGISARYYLYYRNDEDSSTVYICSTEDTTPLQVFPSLNDLLEKYANALLEEYNLDGTKKKPAVVSKILDTIIPLKHSLDVLIDF